MAILSKVILINSLKLSFTNIPGLRPNFTGCESFLDSNFPDILALSETNVEDSLDTGNFSARGYLLLIQKDSVTHMHGLAVYVKKALPLARDLSLKNSEDSYVFYLIYFIQYLTSFSYIDHHLLCTWFLMLFHLT